MTVRRRPFDPFAWALVAWIAAWGLLLAATTVMRVDTAYQRYAAEFLGRVNLAGYPAAAVLGGMAVGDAWTRRGALGWRVVVSVGLVAALFAGAANWRAWFS
jgi:hypothetical protein